jgi:D-methionine transport system ATP-binding protein
VVLITHEMNVVRRIADRVAVLEAGRVLESGPVYDIFTRPASETTRSFVAEAVGYEVPAPLMAMVSQHPGIGPTTLVRVGLMGVAPGEPLMSRVSRNFAVDLRIVAGRIDAIQGRPFGSLVVLTTGAPGVIAAALDYLRQHNVQVEVLGHVPTDDRTAS